MTTKQDERRAALVTEAVALTESGDLVGDDLTRFEEIEAEIKTVDAEIAAYARLAELAKDPKNRIAGEGHPGGQPGAPQLLNRQDPWETTVNRSDPGAYRELAVAAIERWKADAPLQEAASKTLLRLDPEDADSVAEYIVRASNPNYVSAFRKQIRNPQAFGAELNEAERAAYSEMQSYNRAVLQLSGAVVPSILDPAIVITNNGVAAEDSMRRLARTDTTTSKSKRYIKSAGVTASFDSEVAEVSDDTPTLTEKEITCRKAQAFVQASIEAAMDQPNFTEEVARLFADAKAELEAVKFVNGAAATNEPIGLVAAVAAITASRVAPTTAETFGAVDVYKVLEALPPRHRARAQWQLELSTLNKIHRFWNPTGTEPPLLVGNQLLNRTWNLNASMDPYSDLSPATTDSNYLLLLGDHSKYIILDRVGLGIEYLPPGHIVNTANNLPDGRVGWYAWWRVGADVLDVNAFRLLSVPTVGA